MKPCANIRQGNGVEINPKAEPLAITERNDGKLEVDVAQLVKNLNGDILLDGKVKHVYVIDDGLLQRMDIELN